MGVTGQIQRPSERGPRNTMRPPPKPAPAQSASIIGRAPSPAESIISTANTSNNSLKRKEREYDQEGSEETNIHVVVRCRGRSDREVRENSGVVVSTNGVKGKTVELSMGPNAVSNKTYHFDKVFSPAADQTILFEDVVAPILNEMLTGYNCTIFAYGQTGTGKTYTMSGDMTDTYGLLSDAAGIIPRVLYSLFQKLEADEVECSVKCSFIELYNEELRDLLSADEGVKLKIYDDTGRKAHHGTVVQGMEESHIKNATAGIKLLREGSHRRQVAATKCNDLSSRSHTVFTITTFIKKPCEGGEDFICAGKLNLVDLAGSENIQRSGAENKRAAEAGLINKSLLTLGRVINALVDKSSHIPYRESKLTRLLQDSLGGQTKTCIIATVSPAKSNLEETISTLDYAFRAKNIKNKPQINSMISKKTLLREFTAEIEKLKSELIATRQRNGVYLSNEQYEEITVESESRRILSEEQRARIETMETSLRNKVQELFNLTNNMTMLKRDNESVRTTLESTKDVLLKTEAVLKDTEQLLEEEKVVREAYQVTEKKLKTVGNELISTVGSTVRHLNATHSSIRRRSDLHLQNRKAWTSSVAQVTKVTQSVDDFLNKFQQDHEELLTKSSEHIQDFVRSETEKLTDCEKLLVSKTTQLAVTQTVVEQQSSSAKDEMNNVLEEIKVLREEVKERVGQGLQGLNHAAARISGEVIAELDQFHTQLHTSYSGLGKEFKAMFEDLMKQLAAQREENDRLRTALQEANRQNIEASLAASSQLQSSLVEERKAAQIERQTLKDQIFALIESTALKQDERLEASLVRAQTQIIESTEAFEKADQDYAAGMDLWVAQDQRLLEQVTKSRDEVKGKMKTDWTAINSRNAAIQASTKAVHEETVKIVDAQIEEMSTQMAALDEFVTRARYQNDVHHSEHIHSLKQLSTHLDDTFADLRQKFNQRKISMDQFEIDYREQNTELTRSLSSVDISGRQPLQALNVEVSSNPLQDYIPSGDTPQKKDWVFPSRLPSTGSHEGIVAKMRGLPSPEKSLQPYSSTTPAHSPIKQTSPVKASSPSKPISPTKTKVYTDIDVGDGQPIIIINSLSQPTIQQDTFKGLKEIDINLIPRPVSSSALEDFNSVTLSRSVGNGQPPPLKRHATMGAVIESKLPTKITRSKAVIPAGVENFSQSFGVIGGGRRLRSSPPQ